MAKRKRTVGYTIPIFVGKGKSRVRIPIQGKTLKATKAKANSFRRHHLKNINEGFYDASGFHPIRGASDYSAARAGEGHSAAAGRARGKRAAGKTRARKRTSRARRGRQAIS